MLLQASNTPVLLCWLRIMKRLLFGGRATPRKKKNVKYLVVFDVRLENSWRPPIFWNHCASALRQPGCFQVHHAGHLPRQPLKSRVCSENRDGRLRWRKPSTLLLLKLLIFTSSVLKLLCGVLCSQGDNWKFKMPEMPFVVQQAKDLIFLGFLECSDPG